MISNLQCGDKVIKEYLNISVNYNDELVAKPHVRKRSYSIMMKICGEKVKNKMSNTVG